MAKKVDRARRREEILAAAVRVFARRGYAAARIDDVAREAGIAKGSVYLYFDGRESLLHAAFEAVAARSAELLREAAEGDGPAAGRLAALIRGAVTELSADRDLARVLLDIWAAGRDVDSPVDMAAAYRDYRAVVAALLEQAGAEGVPAEGAARAVAAPDAHAAVVVGALEGCLLQWLFDPAVDPAALAEPLVRLLVPGAGAGAGAGAWSGSGGDGRDHVDHERARNGAHRGASTP